MTDLDTKTKLWFRRQGIVSVEVTLTEGENTSEVVATRDKQVVAKTMVITYSGGE